MVILITEFVKTVLTWVITWVAKKIFGKKIDTKVLMPYVAYIVSALLTIIATYFGLVEDPLVSMNISGAGAIVGHALTPQLRRKK